MTLVITVLCLISFVLGAVFGGIWVLKMGERADESVFRSVSPNRGISSDYLKRGEDQIRRFLSGRGEDV